MSLTERLLEISNIGAEWVLWLLVVLSVFSIAAIIERAVFFIRTRERVGELQEKLESFLQQGEFAKAEESFGSRLSMESSVLSKGLKGHEMGATSVGELMNGQLATERIRYESQLGFLATVGSNTPFVGLFGTVLGIINAFSALDLAGGAQVSDGVMAALAEALIATGVGLLVAIPAVVAFNLFRVLVKRRVANTEKLARTLIAYLSSESEGQER